LAFKFPPEHLLLLSLFFLIFPRPVKPPPAHGETVFILKALPISFLSPQVTINSSSTGSFDADSHSLDTSPRPDQTLLPFSQLPEMPRFPSCVGLPTCRFRHPSFFPIAGPLHHHEPSFLPSLISVVVWLCPPPLPETCFFMFHYFVPQAFPFGAFQFFPRSFRGKFLLAPLSWECPSCLGFFPAAFSRVGVIQDPLPPSALLARFFFCPSRYRFCDLFRGDGIMKRGSLSRPPFALRVEKHLVRAG